jgi:peptidoglycan/LPS O-acetylase OafA/YrhL
MSQVTDTPPSAHKMPQLDALRAFAVLSVLFVHFVARPPYWLAIVPWAACGVQLFFVLSGFLITGILLDSRKQVEAGVSRFWMLRQFYTRRFLRIFPLYYAVVLIAWIIKLPGFTDTLGWNLSYLTNFYIVRTGRWIEAASHLWTLSVEEQFYLVWPWVVLFLPSRWLLRTFIAVAIFAVGYRVLASNWLGPWVGITPFASFDCFGAGALLALAQRREKAGDPRLRRILSVIGLSLGIPFLISALVSHFPPQSIAGRAGLMNLAMPLLCMPLISRAAEGFTGIPGILLTQRPLLYIGKISYGIYIFHVPVVYLANLNGSKWLNWLPLRIPVAAVFLIGTLAVAAISWHFFERPINQLKRLFPYRDATPSRRTEEDLVGVAEGEGRRTSGAATDVNCRII